MSVTTMRRATLFPVLSAILALALMLAVQGCSAAPSSSQTAQGETMALTVGRVTLEYPSAWGEAKDAGSTIVSGYTYADAKIACDGSSIQNMVWGAMDVPAANDNSFDRTEHLIVGGGKTQNDVPWDSIVQKVRDAMEREEELSDMLEIISIDGNEVIKVTSTLSETGEGAPTLSTASFMFERDGSLGESIMVATCGKGQGAEDFNQVVKDMVASMHVG